MTFEPVGESSFNMTHEMGKAHERAIVKYFGLKILEKNDVELTAMFSSVDDANVMLGFYENLGELADYYKAGLKCAKGAQARLMVVLTRFAEQEGLDLDGGVS